ncbi:hypothetical protein [Kribbella endophytica]
MSDQDLIDKITTSAHRTDHIELNPETLITAGRRRIRRRRLTVAASAGLLLTAAVAATFTDIRATFGGHQSEVATDRPSVVQTVDPRKLENRAIPALTAVMNKYFGLTNGSMSSGPSALTMTVASSDGTAAVVRVAKLRAVLGGGEPDSPDVCRIRGQLTEFTTCSVIVWSGQQVRVGHRDDRAYFASALRADGTLVMAQLDKDANAPSDGPELVFMHRIEQAELVALVTDPTVPSL